MKTLAAWLVPMIALIATCAAYAQEQPEFPSAEAGCNAPACDTGAFHAVTDKFAAPVWQRFQLSPAKRNDWLLIRQESMLIDPADFIGTTDYSLIHDEPSWEQKISRIKDLSLLTLWQTNDTKIFFGVNSDGFAGLNFSQKSRPTPYLTGPRGAGPTSRPVGPLSPPLVHAQSLTYEKKDLSDTMAAETR